MRKLIICVAILMFNTILNIQAQGNLKNAENPKDKHKNYIKKGDLSLGALYSTNPISTVQNIKYETRGAEVNLAYYALDRIALEANFSAFHYKNKPELNTNLPVQDQELTPLNKKRVLMAGSGIRYNFLEKNHCGTLYLQSGYSFGWFEGNSEKNIHRWEIATIGFTASAIRKFIPNLDLDFRVGIAKDNLNSNLPKLFKAGLTYQFGNIRKNKPTEL